MANGIPRLSLHEIDPTDVAKWGESIFNLAWEINPHSIAQPRVNPLAAAALVAASNGAVSAIIQRDVQDPDFAAEHAVYYSRWSELVPRFCTRIHFFCRRPVATDVLDAIDDLHTTPDSYIGFITLRPVHMSPVGATILRPPVDTGHTYVSTCHEFPVNLGGKRFVVTGTPFMQQDSAVGACAQAAIWMSLRTRRLKEGQSAFTPAEITSAATRFLVNSRTLPNREGLQLNQMAEALRAAGYSPHLMSLRDNNSTHVDIDRVRATIYPYVESGIPVILVLVDHWGGHAVVVVGHSWEEAPSKMIAAPLNAGEVKLPMEAYDAASWAFPFLMHNDNSGPYLPLSDDATEGYHLGQAIVAMPLLSQDVFLDATEAQLVACKHLEQWLERWKDQSSKSAAPPSIVLRTYLQDRSAFRDSVVNSLMSTELKRYYRMKWLPRRVWVIEINEFSGYEASPAGMSKRLGEVLIDAASEVEDGKFLTVHLGRELLGSSPSGLIIDRDAQSGAITLQPADSGAYKPLRVF